jgi:hypothetical protein
MMVKTISFAVEFLLLRCSFTRSFTFFNLLIKEAQKALKKMQKNLGSKN